MSTIKPDWRNWLSVLCGLLFALLASGAGVAQTVTGTISGTVSDASGQVIAGAKVTLTNQQTGNSRTLTSMKRAISVSRRCSQGSTRSRWNIQAFAVSSARIPCSAPTRAWRSASWN